MNATAKCMNHSKLTTSSFYNLGNNENHSHLIIFKNVINQQLLRMIFIKIKFLYISKNKLFIEK